MAPRTAAVVALLFTLALITGCSMAHGDPAHPELNPHPKQRYEVTVTVDAPGPFDSIDGLVSYDIANPECTPTNPLAGVHNMPDSIDRTIELTRVDAHTYRGYFYRDLLEGADYFGKGICRWDAMSASARLKVHGLTFSVSPVSYDVTNGRPLGFGKPQTLFFKTTDYFDRTLNDESGPPMPTTRAESAPAGKPPFEVTVLVMEVKP
jgi:hypothetical protein